MNPGRPSGTADCEENPSSGKARKSSRSWSSRRVYASMPMRRESLTSSPPMVRSHV